MKHNTNGIVENQLNGIALIDGVPDYTGYTEIKPEPAIQAISGIQLIL